VFSSGPSTCFPHANALVCPIHDRCSSGSSGEHFSSHYSERIANFGENSTALLSLLGRSPSAFQVRKRHSIPIASVRRKHQRLPSSLLIENASAPAFFVPRRSCAEAFPIKASDKPSECLTRSFLDPRCCGLSSFAGRVSESGYVQADPPEEVRPQWLNRGFWMTSYPEVDRSLKRCTSAAITSTQ
jgi:hypothetical protein